MAAAVLASHAQLASVAQNGDTAALDPTIALVRAFYVLIYSHIWIADSIGPNP
jgi:hypothetical protein